MDRRLTAGVFTLLLAATALGGVSWALGESSRTHRMEGWASPRILLASADLDSVKLEPLKTVDKTEVYQLSISLREGEKLLPGMEVEYEVHAIDGTAVGGGMFSITQEMLAPAGNSMSVVTGLGGLNLGSRHLLIFKLNAPGLTPARPSGGRQSGQSKQVVTDTCTTFCDRCADNAGSLCSQGTATYDCSCSDLSRSCKFTCQSGTGSSKPSM